MLDSRRQRRVGQVIEHQLRRQALQQVRELDDLLASTLNCTCQPRSATRFASGSIMST